MRVALVATPYRGSAVCSLPIGMASIAGILRQRGHEPVIFDGEVDKSPIDVLAARVVASGAPFIAITSTSYSRDEALQLVALLREGGVGWIGLGGHHFTHMATETLQRVPAVDFVFQGPAETAMSMVASALESGKPFPDDIPGLAWRKGDEIKSNCGGDDPAFMELKRLPYDLFPIHRYSSWDDLLFLYEAQQRENVPPGTTLTFCVGRGCPWRCHFCANVGYWKPSGGREIRSILDELTWLRQEEGINRFIFIDPVFTLHNGRTTELVDGITERKLGLKWFCSTRVNLVDDVLLDKMVASGLSVIQFGVESGSERIINSIDKKLTLNKVRDRVQAVTSRGVRAKVYFMFGHPGEEEEDVIRTIDFTRELTERFGDKLVLVSLFTDIFPGTTLEKVARQEGRLKSDWSWFDEPDLTVNAKIQMTHTRVPMYERVPVERVMELVATRFPRLLNRDLREGYLSKSEELAIGFQA